MRSEAYRGVVGVAQHQRAHRRGELAAQHDRATRSACAEPRRHNVHREASGPTTRHLRAVLAWPARSTLRVEGDQLQLVIGHILDVAAETGRHRL